MPFPVGLDDNEVEIAMDSNLNMEHIKSSKSVFTGLFLQDDLNVSQEIYIIDVFMRVIVVLWGIFYAIASVVVDKIEVYIISGCGFFVKVSEIADIDAKLYVEYCWYYVFACL